MLDYIARLPLLQRIAVILGFGQRDAPEYNEGMPIEEAGETWYTVKEATAISGLSRQRLHQYIQSGRLKVRRTGRAIWIEAQSLNTLQDRHRPTGRPKKSLTKDINS